MRVMILSATGHPSSGRCSGARPASPAPGTRRRRGRGAVDRVAVVALLELGHPAALERDRIDVPRHREVVAEDDRVRPSSAVQRPIQLIHAPSPLPNIP